MYPPANGNKSSARRVEEDGTSNGNKKGPGDDGECGDKIHSSIEEDSDRSNKRKIDSWSRRTATGATNGIL